MQAITQFQMSPADVRDMLIEVLRQASGSVPGSESVPVASIPDLSAAQAAEYLNCSVSTLARVAAKNPEIIHPITTGGKATRYRFCEVHKLKHLV